MNDRKVHASTDEWEIVRYDRAGKWRAEWIGEGNPPSQVNERTYNTRVSSNGFAHLTVKTAAQCAVRLGARIRSGVPGGRAFDREVARIEWQEANR